MMIDMKWLIIYPLFVLTIGRLLVAYFCWRLIQQLFFKNRSNSIIIWKDVQSGNK